MMPRDNTISHPECFSIVTGMTSLSTGTKSIDECLGLLIRTSKGELLGDPAYGTNLMKYIYEPNDLILRDMVIEDLTTAIKNYETRIIVASSDIEVVIDKEYMYITINYLMKNTGTYETFTIYLLRGTYNASE